MKSMIVVLMALSVVSFQAEARMSSGEQAVCKKLTAKAERDCEETMCEDAGMSVYNCEKDGDFYEGFQICVDEELNVLIDAHNKKNPSRKVKCEE
jgi:hypothetical protein